MSNFEKWLRDTIDGQLWEILALGALMYATMFLAAL